MFRTNSSYSRWLDARKTWGLVLNRSRDFTMQVPRSLLLARGLCAVECGARCQLVVAQLVAKAVYSLSPGRQCRALLDTGAKAVAFHGAQLLLLLLLLASSMGGMAGGQGH